MMVAFEKGIDLRCFFFIRYILEGVYSVFAADGTEKAQ